MHPFNPLLFKLLLEAFSLSEVPILGTDHILCSNGTSLEHLWWWIDSIYEVVIHELSNRFLLSSLFFLGDIFYSRVILLLVDCSLDHVLDPLSKLLILGFAKFDVVCEVEQKFVQVRVYVLADLRIKLFKVEIN